MRLLKVLLEVAAAEENKLKNAFLILKVEMSFLMPL